MPEYKDWLTARSNEYHGRCIVWKKVFSIKGNGIVQVRSHDKSRSHVSTFKTVKSQQMDTRCLSSSTLPISSIIKSPGNTSSGSSESLEIAMQKEASYSCSQPRVFAQTQALRDSITRAEIISCLQTVHTHGSL